MMQSTLQYKCNPFRFEAPEIHAFRHTAAEAPFVPLRIFFSVADRPYVMSRKIWSTVSASTPNIK